MSSYSSAVHHAVELESNDELAKQYKKFVSSPKFNLNSQEVYCVCRKPDNGDLMVGCDGCDEWFHFRCMKMDLRYQNLIARFYCKFCRWKGKGTTVYKRKCRLDTCWKPIAPNSKYCSRECGLEFFGRLGRNKEAGKLLFAVNHTEFDHFRTLGETFPELPEVLQAEQNTDTFPGAVRDSLVSIDESLQDVNSKIGQFKAKMAALAQYKEKTKKLNEQIAWGESPEKKARSKKSRKKTELCLYDKNLRNITDEMVQAFNIEDTISAYKNGQPSHVCISEKRKCLRHNGWLSLIHDEFARQIRQLDYKKTTLQHDRRMLLRNYSIEVYEK